MERKILTPVFWVLATCAASFGQSDFQGITPGASTRTDVAGVFGKPVRTVNATRFEYKAPDGLAKLEIEYRAGSAVVERIEVYFLRPIARTTFIKRFNLPQQADARKMDGKQNLVEYFRGSVLLALTYASGDVSSGVSRIEYVSRAVAGNASPENEDAASYAQWYAVRSDIPVAIGKAEAYLERFPNGQYAAYLTTWIAAAAGISFNDAVKAKNVTEVIRIGKSVLAQDPDNLDYLCGLVIQINTNELFARPASFAHAGEQADFAPRVIRLLESGRTPTSNGQPFSRNATLAYMHGTLGTIYEHDQNPDMALKEYETAASLAPSNGTYAFHCGRIHNDRYIIAVRKWQTLPDQSAEANAIFGDIMREIDAIITYWSSGLALTARSAEWGEARPVIERIVTDFRNYRNGVGDDSARSGTASIRKSGKLERLGMSLGAMTRALLQSMKPPDQ